MIEIRRLTEETKNLLFTVEDRRLDSERVVVRPKQSGFELSYRALVGNAGAAGATGATDVSGTSGATGSQNAKNVTGAAGSAWRTPTAQRNIPWDAPAWLEGKQKCVYFAWLDSELAGQVLLEVYENNLCRIRDIRVAVSFRRRGVGEAMIALASDWAKKRALLGLYAETQDVNAGACQFFTKCGFQLGGVDMLRYAARSKETMRAAGLRESALFFYYWIR